ncbi:LPS-responsive vesicle traffickingbeach and anchor containing isoform 1 [Aphelenchoides avenae]|nr:LPS-responsive vesicle traffickingbeach and anchor containing isoform 1 [Aphelenchus avenae]
MSQKEIVDGLFNVLVGGMFDPESRFIIENSTAIIKFVDVLDACPSSLQAEIWSVFVAIVRKNFRNLEACSRVGLISICLDTLPHADSVISDLLVQLLSVLTSYSITVKETKHFLRALQASDGVWRRNSAKLLSVMQEMPKREGADVFFSFPGVASAGLALPPLTKWPYQNGWTFSTWLRMDPLNSVNFEKETPFATAKGIGYYCYFMGNCLVLKCVRAPGKEMTRCIKQELSPRRWHHVAISFIYSRWGQSEIQCFVDGQLAETIDSNWSVSTNDHFDRCFIGCGTESDVNEAFCGQMGAVYVFSQSLTVQQANCLYCLGAAYQSHFKHDAESNLPEGYKKHLFDGRLHSALVFAYCPKNCHGQLCLFPAPKTNPYFVQVPHAIMKMGVEVITSHSIHNSLHSVGGIQMLLPLFAQIDMPHEGREPPVDYAICSSLLSVISLLMNTSSSAQQQLFHSQGFLIIAHVLNSSSEKHLTLNVLEAFIDMAKFLLTCPAGIPLLKQLFDHIFFSPQLWIRTDASIQLRLYKYLANEFVSNANYISIVQRTATIAELMHAIKAYYWIEPPRPAGGAVKTEGQRLSRTAIVEIRALILQVVDHMMFHSPPGCDEKDLNRDEEVQIMFNFISTVSEDDNLYDILSQTMRQMNDHPAVMVPAFDKKRGLCVVFNLVASGNELVRIPALKIFGYFICRSTMKRKNEAINNLNLLHLLSDKLLLNSRFLTLATYNVLFEILIEQVSPDILFVKHEDPPVEGTSFENPSMLKVIANLIAQSEETPELLRVKKVFLTDIIRLCRDSKENRRTILQMSVWQEWLIALAYVFPENKAQEEISDLVYELFAILLFHAIRLEFGGWRVWVDTLAIAHSKVSWDRYRLKLRKAQEAKTDEDAQKAVVDAVNGMVASTVEAMEGSETPNKSEQQPLSAKRRAESANDTPSSLYRTPEFSWSDVHVRLLNDLLTSVEHVVDEWNESATLLVDHTNNSDNQVFISNTVHVLSQLTDSLIMACGGLLPLLAAATSPTSELEIADSTQQELTMENAVQFLVRFAELADVFIFVSGVSFSELEQEKNMPNGGILRQTLRLVSTMAVRNILACRLTQQDRGFAELSNKHPAKYNAIRKFVDKASEVKDASKGITDVDRLLQEVDLQRLKSIVYRDMDESRQAQFLALAVVYLLSVLMVSRYRDILEPPTSPSPFFDTNSDSSARKISADSVGERKVTVNSGSQVPVVPNGVSKGVSTASDDESESTAREIVPEEVEEEQSPDGVSSIRFRETQTPQSQPEKYHTDHLAQ